jgi:hypothetical protein
VLLVDALRGGSSPENLNLRLYLLFGGTIAGVVLSAWAAWHLLAPISSAYRRGGLAMVFGFATVLLMLVCIPVHQVFGRAGLGALLALSSVTAALLSRRAKRLGFDA